MPSPRSPAATAKRPAWSVVGVALFPVWCCGLPLLLTAIGSVSAGAVVRGGAGLALLTLAAVALTVRGRERCRPRRVARRDTSARPTAELVKLPRS